MNTFTSVSELLKYLEDNNIGLSGIEITLDVPETDPKSDQHVTDPDMGDTLDDVESSADTVKLSGKIKTMHDDPILPVEESSEDVIYVKDFTITPDACHMGEIDLCGKTVYAGICTEGEVSSIKLLVEIDRGDNLDPLLINRDFKLRKIDENIHEKIVINSVE